MAGNGWKCLERLEWLEMAQNARNAGIKKCWNAEKLKGATFGPCAFFQEGFP